MSIKSKIVLWLFVPPVLQKVSLGRFRAIHNAVLKALVCSLRASQKGLIHVVILFMKGVTIPRKVRLVAKPFLTRCTYLSYLVGVLALSACGSSAKDESNQYRLPITEQSHKVLNQGDAAKFLNRTTFGATTDEIDKLLNYKTYDSWLNEQFNIPASLHVPRVAKLADKMCANVDDDGTKLKDSWEIIYPRHQVWWETVMNSKDQLRQRVAFALSEILVISESDGLGLSDLQFAITSYYDVLVKHAFGNYRDLLEEVTLHPAMGDFLSMTRNQKANIKEGIRPDENYAREILQLFTIGVHELNIDGSEKLDGSNNANQDGGKPIPTYNQKTIEQFAKVFTGWNYADKKWHEWAGNADHTKPLVAVEKYHDKTEKVLLGGNKIPANQTAKADLVKALDNIFKHPNVAPFISKQLIQRLVTSNPSPAYVRRVAEVFNNNGSGVKGDLKAVISAILLDDDVLPPYRHKQSDNFGKLREPILRISHLWRAFKMQAALRVGHRWKPEKTCGQGTYDYYNFWTGITCFSCKTGQGPLQAKSVFNFFRPDYSPNGPLNDAGLSAPEFQIVNESTIVGSSNLLHLMINRFSDSKPLVQALKDEKGKEQKSQLNLATETALAKDTQKLLAHLDLVLLNDEMSDPLKAILTEHLNKDKNFHQGERGQLEKAREAILLISSSPEYLIQR
ncbi:MAG TPA: DUF1800 domain-containing protein [Leucothrix sp.]|nr:DUF1800 domain-containing protein [Leucothrix sp.]